jgi:WD40 repeat protein
VAGGRLVTVSQDDGNAVVFSLEAEPKSKARLLVHPQPLGAVAVTQDGKVVATGGAEPIVYLWRTNGEKLGTIDRLPGSINCLAFSPDGKYLAIGANSDLYLVEITVPFTGVQKRRRLLEMQYFVSGVAFSHDGKRLAACTYGATAYTWDLATRTKTAVAGKLSKELTNVAFSRDSQQLAVIGRQGLVHLSTDNQPARQVAHSLGSPFCITFGPVDGTLIYPAVWGAPLRVHHLASDETTLVPLPAQGAVYAVHLSPDGKLLATGFSDGSTWLWDVICEESQPR